MTVVDAEEVRELTPYENELEAKAEAARRVLAAQSIDRTQVLAHRPVILPEEGEPVWERLPKEPIAWYDRFDSYRELPLHERSVAAACRSWCRRVGRPVPKRAPAEWSIRAKVWLWARRAEAFDEHQMQLLRTAETEEKLVTRKARRARLNKLEGITADVLQGFQQLVEESPNAVQPKDVIALVKLLHAEQRTEYDDNPAKKVLYDGDVDVSHKVYMGWDPKKLAQPAEESS